MAIARLEVDMPHEEMRGRLADAERLLAYLNGGKAIVTIRSLKTAERYTFKFSRTPEGSTRDGLWVALLNSPSDSPEDRYYEFLGTIWKEPSGWNYRHSRKSRMGESSAAVRAILWLVARVNRAEFSRLFEQAEFWHEGRCGRCGRRLTVPESITTGFGPECSKRVH